MQIWEFESFVIIGAGNDQTSPLSAGNWHENGAKPSTDTALIDNVNMCSGFSGYH